MGVERVQQVEEKREQQENSQRAERAKWEAHLHDLETRLAESEEARDRIQSQHRQSMWTKLAVTTLPAIQEKKEDGSTKDTEADSLHQSTDRIDRLSVQIHTLTEAKHSLKSNESMLKSELECLEREKRRA